MTGATSDGKLSRFPITRLHGWLCALGNSGLKWWETYNLDIVLVEKLQSEVHLLTRFSSAPEPSLSAQYDTVRHTDHAGLVQRTPRNNRDTVVRFGIVPAGRRGSW